MRKKAQIWVLGPPMGMMCVWVGAECDGSPILEGMRKAVGREKEENLYKQRSHFASFQFHCN